jgi:hypothetical protein
MIIGDPYALTFLGRGTPLVNDVTTYWFGRLQDMEASLWTQVTERYHFEGDSGFAFTWQNISFAAGSNVSRAAILKFGLPNVNSLTLTLSVLGGIETVFSGAPVIVATVNSYTEATVNILLVIDDDASEFWRVAADKRTGDEFDFMIQPSHYGVTPGVHKFAFYAVDHVGTISEEVSFWTGRTATPRETRLPVTQSPATGGDGSSGKKLPMAAVIGIVIAAVVLVAVAIGLTCYIRRDRLAADIKQDLVVQETNWVKDYSGTDPREE